MICKEVKKVTFKVSTKANILFIFLVQSTGDARQRKKIDYFLGASRVNPCPIVAFLGRGWPKQVAFSGQIWRFFRTILGGSFTGPIKSATALDDHLDGLSLPKALDSKLRCQFVSMYRFESTSPLVTRILFSNLSRIHLANPARS